jgi:error-prone DNA polymerase
MSYVELHARSAFSFLRGASQPEHLAECAVQRGLAAMALCDRNGVHGAPRYYTKANELGLRALVGSELRLEDDSVLPVLVRNRTGYRNLCRMLTRAQLRAPKGESRISWEELGEFHEGLLALTGDAEGPLHAAIYSGDRYAADRALGRIVNAFGADHVYVELQRHRLPREERIVDGLIELAGAHHLPVVATNGILYAEPWGRDVLDVFTCLRHHTHLDAAGLLLSPNSQRHLKTPAQMAALFADVPEAITNTERIAEQLEFTLNDLGYQFPDFPVPEGQTMPGFLRELTYAGARQRYASAVPDAVRAQLEKELDLITRLGFSGYFLIVADLVKFARDENILIQGRGSAANSAVCYALGITAVDPVESKLLFERFLSEGRKSWPDIDLDLPSGDRREKVIQEVFRRYGRHGAAMTANVITYRGRSAMREIGKALNFSEDILKRFSDLFASGDFAHTLELEDQIVQAGIPREHPRFRPLVQLYHRMYGLPRHLGQHSGGMVISRGRLDDVVPLENASMPGRTVVQWDKDDCEDLGIIKVDLLGLGMMAVLQDAAELTRQRGHGIDLALIPKDDAATFELMQKADTVGTFQVESRAQMATLPRMKPKTFYDVAIEVAIIRPGPIQGRLTHPYLARRSGKEEVTYMHPDLVPVLERTLGVPLFQEQMLRIAMVVAGFDGSEAEELRRAISFHRSHERMGEKVVVKLRAAMTARAIAPETQEQIVHALSSFALYGFPESHAISFALLAYASCWLKVHRAPEFYCALLNNQPMGFYSPATLMKDGKRRGVKFRPVCVVRSGARCEIEEDSSIRLGLNYVQGLHRDRATLLVEEREKRPFSDLEDLLTRVRLNKGERRVLAKIGALNFLGNHRRSALWKIEAHFDEDDLLKQNAASCDLGGARSPGQQVVRATPQATEWIIQQAQNDDGMPLQPMNPLERLQADYGGTGVTTGPHPMSFLRAQLPHITRAADLARAHHGRTVIIAGVVICRQRPGTAKGNVFVSLEDETGVANAFVSSALFEELRLTITHEPFLEIEGRLQVQEGVISVMAKKIRALNAPTAIATQSYDFR